MKKNGILLYLLTLLTFNCAIGQEDSANHRQFSRWSIDVIGGYGFPFAQLYTSSSVNQQAPGLFIYTSEKGSLGAGILNALTVGYRIKERIGFEIGLFANWGSELQTYHYYSDVYPDLFDDRYSRVNTRGILAGFFVSENVGKIEIGLHNYFMLSFYNRGYYRQRRGDANEEFITRIEDTGGFGIGWMNKLSINYKWSEHFSIGLNGFVVLQSWAPKQGEFVEKSLNGNDGVPTMPDEYRIFTYPTNYTNQHTNPYVITSAFSYPLHSFGVAVNIGYTF